MNSFLSCGAGYPKCGMYVGSAATDGRSRVYAIVKRTDWTGYIVDGFILVIDAGTGQTPWTAHSGRRPLRVRVEPSGVVRAVWSGADGDMYTRGPDDSGAEVLASFRSDFGPIYWASASGRAHSVVRPEHSTSTTLLPVVYDSRATQWTAGSDLGFIAGRRVPIHELASGSDNALLAFSPRTGRILWERLLPESLSTAPLQLTPSGSVVFHSWERSGPTPWMFRLFDSTGAQRMACPLASAPMGEPMVVQGNWVARLGGPNGVFGAEVVAYKLVQ